MSCSMSSTRTLMIMGTRPEAIKMAPVVRLCQQNQNIEPIIGFTGQHKEMLAQVAEYFDIRPDFDLKLMQSNQTLAGITARCLEGIDKAIERYRPDCLVAQGDTTTVMAASMAAFYRRLPFIHVEAGLRTRNLNSPWSEEFNRRVVGMTTSTHCAPTQNAANNLLAEGVLSHTVHVTGNTVVDALLWTVERERQNDHVWRRKYQRIGNARVVLITAHRRENFGTGFESACCAIRTLAERFQDIAFIYPVHLNPNVREPVYRLLSNCSNVHLIEPAPYPEFVWLMDRSCLILTDSGGVQEEAPSLGKPVIVMRDTTERGEAVDAGAVRLVGTSRDAIVSAASKLLTDPQAYARCQIDVNPYGDGAAAERIVQLIESRAWNSTALHSAA